nr:hypothetical protein [Paenarthrobacter sp. MMS21-TAE1-1]
MGVQVYDEAGVAVGVFGDACTVEEYGGGAVDPLEVEKDGFAAPFDGEVESFDVFPDSSLEKPVGAPLGAAGSRCGAMTASWGKRTGTFVLVLPSSANSFCLGPKVQSVLKGVRIMIAVPAYGLCVETGG